MALKPTQVPTSTTEDEHEHDLRDAFVDEDDADAQQRPLPLQSRTAKLSITRLAPSGAI